MIRRWLLALAMVLFVAAPAQASEWVDPSLRPDGHLLPTSGWEADAFVPGSSWDDYLTHGELAWVREHGLHRSAMALVRQRATAPPPVAAGMPNGRPLTPAGSNLAPALPAVPGGAEAWRGLVEAYFAPGDVAWALRVIQCESRGNPGATNASSGAAGLFQQLPRYWPERAAAAGWAGASPYDPEANVAVSAWLFYTGGPGHWVCK